MTAILRTPAIRALEQRYADVEPPLMERAGAAVAACALDMLGDDRRPALIVAGPGNNGGDGFVAARLLKEQGRMPVVVFAGEAERLPGDARAALEEWKAVGGTVQTQIPHQDFGLVVDALFGIGLTRPLTGSMAGLVEAINACGRPVLAVDIPSGLDADTGQIHGCAVRAGRTATFIALKPGLLTRAGPDHCGGVQVHDLGIAIETPEGELLTPALFRHRLRPRDRDSHKGSFGSVGILGGAPGMAGAALLAGRAALKLGAGRVHVGMLERLAVDPVQPELMLRPAREVFGLATVLAAGPGLGQSPAAIELLRRAIETSLPLVIDADGLNLLAAHRVLFRHLGRREAATVLTPHPAEAARLLATSTEAVQADRVNAALELARRSRALVVLKGCGSVVADANGRWFVNASGNAGLASAGSGDVLTGIVAGLIAQGWPAHEALAGGVHLHGAAADALVAQHVGPVGLAAGELIDAARLLLNRWTAND